jgi:hypothetical protein
MQAAMLRGSAFTSRVGMAPMRRPQAVSLAPRPQALAAPSFVGGEQRSDAHWAVSMQMPGAGSVRRCTATCGVDGAHTAGPD